MQTHSVELLRVHVMLLPEIIDGCAELCIIKTKHTDIAVCNRNHHTATYHMGSHSATCHPAALTFPPLPQPKLVLDLATPADLGGGYIPR